MTDTNQAPESTTPAEEAIVETVAPVAEEAIVETVAPVAEESTDNGENNVADGFALRSIFQPEEGFYVGISPTSTVTDGGFVLTHYLKYADVGQALADLKNCVAHAEQTIQSIIYHQGVAAGRAEALTAAQIPTLTEETSAGDVTDVVDTSATEGSAPAEEKAV